MQMPAATRCRACRRLELLRGHTESSEGIETAGRVDIEHDLELARDDTDERIWPLRPPLPNLAGVGTGAGPPSDQRFALAGERKDAAAGRGVRQGPIERRVHDAPPSSSRRRILAL